MYSSKRLHGSADDGKIVKPDNADFIRNGKIPFMTSTEHGKRQKIIVAEYRYGIIFFIIAFAILFSIKESILSST